MLFEVPLPPEYIARTFSSSTSGGSQNKSVPGLATFASVQKELLIGTGLYSFFYKISGVNEVLAES
jgi:hypothetical protein